MNTMNWGFDLAPPHDFIGMSVHTPKPPKCLESSDLWVVTPINNPIRYNSRWKLYKRFAEHMKSSGVNLMTVELAYGERQFAIDPDENYGEHLKLRSRSVLWSKENLINIGVSHLPESAKYIAWIDADIQFMRPDWATETVEKLQLFDAVQLFSHAQDLSPSHDAIGHHRPLPPKLGFMYSWWNDVKPSSPRYDGADYHPGYAWAMRRECFTGVGGLIDFAILGSADRHMAMSFVNKSDLSMPRDISPAYRRAVHAWEERAQSELRHGVHYVSGMINHAWHGAKRNRHYASRWKVLTRNHFDPATDIKRDWSQHGLIELSGNKPRLRNDVIKYMSSRNEDCIFTGQ